MAYDEYTAERIRSCFRELRTEYVERKMFGGLTFFVDEKMCCGVMYHKKRGTDYVMGRVGEETATRLLGQEGYQPMDFAGRAMKNYVFVTPDGYDAESELLEIVRLCVAFNPLAKRSKK